MGRYTTVAISKNQYQEIIDLVRGGYYDGEVDHRPNPRLATVLILEANLGCRLSDIISMTTESVIKDGNHYRLNITEQKTKKPRSFIVPDKLKSFIDDYIQRYSIPKGEKLFKFGEAAVWKQLRFATNYLNMEHVSSHSFRKKAANDLYERSNYDIMKVSQFLQHASINTTRAYIKRSDADMEAAINEIVDLA